MGTYSQFSLDVYITQYLCLKFVDGIVLLRTFSRPNLRILYHMYFSVYFVLYTTIILVRTIYKIDYFCPGLLSKYLAMFRSHDDLQSVVCFPWRAKLLEMKARLAKDSYRYGPNTPRTDI